MIPRVINQCWFGEPMPAKFAAWGEQFRALNPGWRYVLHGNKQFAAACKVDPALRALRDAGADWAAITDRYRLLMLREHGGAFFDADAQPLRPLDTVHAVFPASVDVVMSAGGSVQCMFAATDSRLVALALETLWDVPGRIVRGSAVERFLMAQARPGEFFGVAKWLWDTSPTDPRAFVEHNAHRLASWGKW